jgi:hypothetical protein
MLNIFDKIKSSVLFYQSIFILFDSENMIIKDKVLLFLIFRNINAKIKLIRFKTYLAPTNNKRYCSKKKKIGSTPILYSLYSYD